MARLNRSLNQPNAWMNMLATIHRRIEVDPGEVDRVIEIARRTPDLAGYTSALPHEAGHDTYATVTGLAEELEDAMQARMRAAVRNGELNIPSVQLDLRPHGVSYSIVYTGEELIAEIWRSWTNEAQADLVGLLNCGGAAAIALQQIVGFDAEDVWLVNRGQNGWVDGPEVHPTSYVRNALNIAALLIMDSDHAELADEIEARVLALAGHKPQVTWRLANTEPVVSIPMDQMVLSAGLAAEVILTHPLTALGGKSYMQLCSFDGNDQSLVDAMAKRLLAGEPHFAQEPGGRPCHALAATAFAFESEPGKANEINYLFKRFV